MPNVKISALTADTAPTADDLVVTVNDPGGTPATRRATITNFTKAIPAVVGDAGAGGTKGLVPAPAAGDAAAGKFLKADGTFAVPTGTGAETGANSDITSMDGLTGALENPTKIVFPEAAAPATPGANKVVLYAKSDGLLYSKDDAGLETAVTGGGGSTLTADSVSAPVFAQDAGANDTYTATLSPVPSGYTTGTHYRFKANTANTGACSINFNGLGAKTIKKVAGGITTDLADNDIRAGQWVDLIYDGTNMQMQSTLGNAPAGASVNPTSGVLPYNAAGTFADSPITRLSSTIVGATNFQASTEFTFTGGAGIRGTTHDGVFNLRNSGGGGGTISATPLTPAQITSNQDNYNPGGFSYVQRWSTDASRDITGLDPTGGGTTASGQLFLVINVGAFDIVLKHENASSVAARRFLNSTGADITLTPNQAADLVYDNTASRWRVFKRN